MSDPSPGRLGGELPPSCGGRPGESRRTPHGTRATDEEGSEHETVMYIGVCGAATQKFEVTGHVRRPDPAPHHPTKQHEVTGNVRTEGGHEGSLPPELTYTNVNAHRKT